MNASTALDNLTFESAEVFVDDVKASDAVTTDLLNPVYENGYNDMVTVFDTYKGIVDRKYICRGDMVRVNELSTQFPVLTELVEQYPINSFTLEPSTVNLDVSMEGFARTAYEAVVKALRDILDFIVASFKKFWQFMRNDAQRTQAVDDVSDKLVAIQNYILEVDKVVSSTRMSSDFKRIKDGELKSELRNLKKWNGLKNSFLTNPGGNLEMFKTISEVIKVKIPPFVDAVGAFLTALTQASSESEVDVAIAQMELLDMTSASLTKLVADKGYSARGVQINAKMTNFQAMSVFLLGTLRGLENDRPQVSDIDFTKAVVSYTIVPWGDTMNEVIAFSSTRTAPIMARLEAFNEKSLKPGLEDVYINKLSAFFISLTSILQGFTALENSMGMLVSNRNNVTAAISKAALQVAKAMDAFVLSKRDDFSVAEQAIIWRHRKALIVKF